MLCREIATAVVSAISLKQCALPRARTFGLAEMISWSSLIDAGSANVESWKLTVPDQFALIN